MQGNHKFCTLPVSSLCLAPFAAIFIAFQMRVPEWVSVRLHVRMSLYLPVRHFCCFFGCFALHLIVPKASEIQTIANKTATGIFSYKWQWYASKIQLTGKSHMCKMNNSTKATIRHRWEPNATTTTTWAANQIQNKNNGNKSHKSICVLTLPPSPFSNRTELCVHFSAICFVLSRNAEHVYCSRTIYIDHLIVNMW